MADGTMFGCDRDTSSGRLFTVPNSGAAKPPCAQPLVAGRCGCRSPAGGGQTRRPSRRAPSGCVNSLLAKLPRFAALVLLALVCAIGPAQGQQYNSDSWVSKPHGTVTTILTFGERQSLWMMTFSLIPRCEFTSAVYVYNNDDDPSTDDGYSTSFYGKYMFYENDAKTGGFAVKAGTGLGPGYMDGDERLQDAWKSFWTNAPITIPFFGNRLSWDIMPGASATIDYGEEKTTKYAFTYSTRLAWYPVSPKLAIVGEVFGSEGLDASSKYRAGLRSQIAKMRGFSDEIKRLKAARGLE